MGVDRNDPEVEKLVRADIPLMAVDLDVVHDHTSFVASDNIGGARLAVRHLHALGHTRIAAIAGPRNTKPGADRTLGFRAEMRELGLKIPRGYEIEGDFCPESGERAMQSMLRLAEPPTAVFAAADMMAVGAIQTMRAAGLSVPDDLAIVGFDDLPFAAYLSPPLTTIRQDMVGIGLAAGRALVEQIENPDVTPPVLTLPVELVVRASCGASAAVHG
jgi:LacI family transcriptional regulator